MRAESELIAKLQELEKELLRLENKWFKSKKLQIQVDREGTISIKRFALSKD